MRTFVSAVMVVATLIAAMAVARAEPGTLDGDYNIMAPEPGTKAPPARKHPRGSSGLVTPIPLPPPLHYVPPAVPTVAPPTLTVPPSVYVPQTGMSLPNLGPGRSETSQDRAARCANQAGVYGSNLTGNRNAYIGSCINQ